MAGEAGLQESLGSHWPGRRAAPDPQTFCLRAPQGGGKLDHTAHPCPQAGLLGQAGRAGAGRAGPVGPPWAPGPAARRRPPPPRMGLPPPAARPAPHRQQRQAAATARRQRGLPRPGLRPPAPGRGERRWRRPPMGRPEGCAAARGQRCRLGCTARPPGGSGGRGRPEAAVELCGGPALERPSSRLGLSNHPASSLCWGAVRCLSSLP